MGNWDGCVEDDKCENDVNMGAHVWFNNEKKKNEYYARFQKKQLNDIRFVLDEKDISTILRSQLGITSNNDIKYILNGINKYKEENEKYKKWINETVKLGKEYQALLEKHAIYTFEALFCKIKNKLDVIQIFGQEQEMTAGYLWKFIVDKHQSFVPQHRGYYNNQKPLQNRQNNNHHHRNNNHRYHQLNSSGSYK